MDPRDAGDALDGMAEISREIGIDPPPVVLGAPGYRSTDALAFGLQGKRYVALDNGLITQFYVQPERFSVAWCSW